MDTKNVELVNHVTNDPNARGRDEVMTAEAISRVAGKLKIVYLSDDIVATPNIHYISDGQHNVVLPDPDQAYITYADKTLLPQVGDLVIVDQIDGVGSVESFDGSSAERLDTNTEGTSIRFTFELLPTTLGNGKHWKRHIA